MCTQAWFSHARSPINDIHFIAQDYSYTQRLSDVKRSAILETVLPTL